MSENWRKLPSPVRSEFIQWVDERTADRQRYGHQTHGDLFKGDPLDHLVEELFDALFYAWQEKRRQHERDGAE